MQAVDPNKDQSYFLFPITSEALSKTLFPLGGMTNRGVGTRRTILGYGKEKGIARCLSDSRWQLCNFLTGHNKDSLMEVVRLLLGKETLLVVKDDGSTPLGTTWLGCGYGETHLCCRHRSQKKSRYWRQQIPTALYLKWFV